MKTWGSVALGCVIGFVIAAYADEAGYEDRLARRLVLEVRNEIRRIRAEGVEAADSFPGS